ncbi:MAG: hypothetical protein QM831_25795 [Kofleriaceae bacterium]
MKELETRLIWSARVYAGLIVAGGAALAALVAITTDAVPAAALLFGLIGVMPAMLVHARFHKGICSLQLVRASGHRVQAQVVRRWLEVTTTVWFGFRHVTLAWYESGREYRTEIAVSPIFHREVSAEVIVAPKANKVVVIIGGEMFLGPKLDGKLIPAPLVRVLS